MPTPPRSIFYATVADLQRLTELCAAIATGEHPQAPEWLAVVASGVDMPKTPAKYVTVVLNAYGMQIPTPMLQTTPRGRHKRRSMRVEQAQIDQWTEYARPLGIHSWASAVIHRWLRRLEYYEAAAAGTGAANAALHEEVASG